MKNIKPIAWIVLIIGVVAIAPWVVHYQHSYRVLGVMETHRLQSQYQAYLNRLEQRNVERPTLSPASLWAQIEAGTVPVILDVRSDQEYKMGHVPGAIHLDYRDFPQQLADIPARKDDEVVIYCRTGVRAGVAEELLREAGFTSVVHLDGDMMGWIERGWPVEPVE